MYPVTNYTLDIINLRDDSMLPMNTAINTSFSINNLQEDSVYSFKIVASNSVGVISSNSTMFCKLSKFLSCHGIENVLFW